MLAQVYFTGCDVLSTSILWPIHGVEFFRRSIDHLVYGGQLAVVYGSDWTT